MPKGYISKRQQNLKIGITSYTDNKTVLEVTGNVGINTSNSKGYSLNVIGNTNISGIVSAASYYGDASNMTGIVTSLTGAAVTTLTYGDSKVSISSTDGSILLQSNGTLVASISSERVNYYVPIDMGNNKISSLGDPVALKDASNKKYVDDQTGQEFPFGDYGSLNEGSSDAFGQIISNYISFDCLTQPAGRLDEIDLEITY